MSEPITILVNGEPLPIEPGQTLLDLLRTLEVDPELGGVAIAVGLRVIPKSAWSQTPMNPGDEIEIIRATAGG
ncbi:MAG: sulfur carrier protein ThiS [Myxococcota bacterium]